jgi:hypothetical protein
MSGWRFLLDENTDPKTAMYLEKEEIHAEHVRDALWGPVTKRMSYRTPENTN